MWCPRNQGKTMQEKRKEKIVSSLKLMTCRVLVKILRILVGVQIHDGGGHSPQLQEYFIFGTILVRVLGWVSISKVFQLNCLNLKISLSFFTQKMSLQFQSFSRKLRFEQVLYCRGRKKDECQLFISLKKVNLL